MKLKEILNEIRGQHIIGEPDLKVSGVKAGGAILIPGHEAGSETPEGANQYRVVAHLSSIFDLATGGERAKKASRNWEKKHGSRQVITKWMPRKKVQFYAKKYFQDQIDAGVILPRNWTVHIEKAK